MRYCIRTIRLHFLAFLCTLVCSFGIILYQASNLPSTNQASNLPSNNEGKTQEIIHVTDALKANGYPSTVISNTLNKKAPSQTVPPPEELVSMFFKWADPPDAYRGFACLPYLKVLTEPLTRLLRNNEILVVSKPFKTHQQEFLTSKFRQPMDLQTNVVYKIPRSDCSWNDMEKLADAFKLERKNTKEILKLCKRLKYC